MDNKLHDNVQAASFALNKPSKGNMFKFPVRASARDRILSFISSGNATASKIFPPNGHRPHQQMQIPSDHVSLTEPLHTNPLHTPHFVTETEFWYCGTASKQVFFTQLARIMTVSCDIVFPPSKAKSVRRTPFSSKRIVLSLRWLKYFGQISRETPESTTIRLSTSCYRVKLYI